MGVTLNSISPASGPPGTAITLSGAGFDASSQAACPVLVPTVLVDSGNTLTAAIPADLEGAGGTSMLIGIYVVNGDGTASAPVTFTVEFPAVDLQAWTGIAAVCGEVPGFARGGQIKDDKILNWIKSAAQGISAAMLRRGLPVDPTQWPAAGTTGAPTAVAVLERANRLGAAASLAAAISSRFTSGEWGLCKKLDRDYQRELTALEDGNYDHLFIASAATVETGPQFAGGNTDNAAGRDERAFRKDMVF